METISPVTEQEVVMYPESHEMDDLSDSGFLKALYGASSGQ